MGLLRLQWIFLIITTAMDLIAESGVKFKVSHTQTLRLTHTPRITETQIDFELLASWECFKSAEK